MVICWKLRTRTLLTLRMSGEEAVINRSFGMSSDVYPPGDYFAAAIESTCIVLVFASRVPWIGPLIILRKAGR
jgi:hypothetical protein